MKRDADQTKHTILQSAIRHFAASGLAGARIDQIAAESGSNKRMIYHYFGGKQELYEKVIEEQMKHMFRHMEEPKGESEEEIIRNAIGLYFDYCHKHPDYISLMIWEMVMKWETLEKLTIPEEHEWHNRMIQILESGMQKGLFHSKTQPRLFMTMTILQVFCFFPVATHPNLLHARKESDALDLTFYKEQLIEQVMRSILI